MVLNLYRIESIHTTGNPEYGKFKTLIIAVSLEKAIETYKREYKGPIVVRATKLDIVGDEILIQTGAK